MDTVVIRVGKTTRQRLNIMKAEQELRSLDDTINELINHYKSK